MKTITVNFNTKTPLWTGDAWRKGDNLKLTGILGSLRWWFEALVRGMGYKACDSTDDKCQVEIKNPDDVLNIHKKICPVCYLFGTTGWKSRFSVVVNEVNLNSISKFEVRTRTKNRKNNKYLSRYCDGLFGSFTLTFSFLPDVPDEYICLFVKLLDLLNEYGMIGAKISQGNGVCSIEIKSEFFDVNGCLDKKFSDINLHNFLNQKNCIGCSNLSDFKFLKVILELNNNVNFRHIWRKNNNDSKKLKDFNGNIDDLWNNKAFLPISFYIRDLLRGLLRSDSNLRHTLMGEMGKGAKVFVSHGYKVNESKIQFRIIGYGLKEWQTIEESLTEANLNNFLWFNKKKKIYIVNIMEKVSGKDLISGGSES